MYICLRFLSLFYFLDAGIYDAVLPVVMMIAIPNWQGRVSPVLDVAGALLLVAVEGSSVLSRQSVVLPDDTVLERAKRIKEFSVDVLVCGAVSWPLETALLSAGIEVISQNCGEVEEVLQAFLSGQLQKGAYLMPGCCRRRRRCRGGGGGRGRRRNNKN